MKLHRILLSGMLVPCLALFVYGGLPVKGYVKKVKPYVKPYQSYQPYYQPYVNYGYTGNYNYNYYSGKNSYGKSSNSYKNYWY